MVEQEKERKPLVSKLSEEAQGAINIARALASRVRKEGKEGFDYYVEPMHLVMGLSTQPSPQGLLLKGGVREGTMTMNYMVGMLSVFFEFDSIQESGKHGGFSYRSKMAMTFASIFAESAGRAEISSIDIMHGIIMEDIAISEPDPDIEINMPTDWIKEHKKKRSNRHTAGSFLESVIGLPNGRRTMTINGRRIRSLFRPKLRDEVGGEQLDLPPEISE